MKKKYQKNRGKVLLLMLLWGLLSLTGCQKETDNLEKVRDLAFTVTAEENIPEELLKTLQEKQTDGFKVTYQDNGFMYLCRGYGEQETGGYSIVVESLYETVNAIYFDTTLKGPEPGENGGKKESMSYPYIVVKAELVDKPVVFE